MGRRKYRTRFDCHFAWHFSHPHESFSGLSGESAPVQRHRWRSPRASGQRRRRRRKEEFEEGLQEDREKAPEAKSLEESFKEPVQCSTTSKTTLTRVTRITCRYGYKPSNQTITIQKHTSSAFLCICQFGDWKFSFTATLATRNFRLLPHWRVLQKRFFEPWLSLQYSPKTLSGPHQEELRATSGHNARATRCTCISQYVFFFSWNPSKPTRALTPNNDLKRYGLIKVLPSTLFVYWCAFLYTKLYCRFLRLARPSHHLCTLFQ